MYTVSMKGDVTQTVIGTLDVFDNPYPAEAVEAVYSPETGWTTVTYQAIRDRW